MTSIGTRFWGILTLTCMMLGLARAQQAMNIGPGINTLSLQERSEGWRLLFDGKTMTVTAIHDIGFSFFHEMIESRYMGIGQIVHVNVITNTRTIGCWVVRTINGKFFKETFGRF